MAEFIPPLKDSSSRPSERFFNRVLYGFVRRLVRLSHVLVRDSPSETRAKNRRAQREQALRTIIGELSARGFLDVRDVDSATRPTIRLIPTGSSVNVAIIPEGARNRALVLKFTDAAAASVELTTSSHVQEELRADPRLSSWSSHIPQIVTSGQIGTTTFSIEQCLSSRDGRAVAQDPVAANLLISGALAEIDAFHRVTASRRQVDAQVLAAIVDRPIEVLRENTSPGPFHLRARSIDRLASWLRQSLLGFNLGIGWVHGDFHLGNVIIDDRSNRVTGVIDWGRAEADGLTVLDGFTLIVLERARSADEDIGSFVLNLLRSDKLSPENRAYSEALSELAALLSPESNLDLRSLLMLTWLKHVTNNLKNEERTRSHGLWMLRTVDLVLWGAGATVGY